MCVLLAFRLIFCSFWFPFELFYLSMFVSIETGEKYNRRKSWKENSNDIKAQEGANVYENDHLMV